MPDDAVSPATVDGHPGQDGQPLTDALEAADAVDAAEPLKLSPPPASALAPIWAPLVPSTRPRTSARATAAERQDAPAARRETATAVLAAVVAGDQSLTEILHLVAQLAVTTVDGIDEASVTLYRDGAARTAGFAGPHAAALDERQYETGSGPCLEAARTGARVLVASTAPGRAGDFEDFAYHARRAGIASATCLPLGVPGRVVGALNTFARGEHPLQGAGLAAAEAFAAAAAVVVASAANVAAATEAAGNMRAAMEHRAVIEQAKGVLIAQLGLDPEAAFAELRRLSQRDNVKLRQVAVGVVAEASEGR